MSVPRVTRTIARFVVSGAVALALALGVAAPAWAANNVAYIDSGGRPQTAATATDVRSDNTSWGAADGQEHWYVAKGKVTVNQRVTVTGEVHLILVDDASLTVKGGINVAAGMSLTIYGQQGGTGMLDATAPGGDAGIGGYAAQSCGNVTINGGVIKAQGNTGIGGGQGTILETYGGNGGTVTINGGRVTAIGTYGAGIGGGVRGDGYAVNGAGGTVTITGGFVHAESQGVSAGIGGGGQGAAEAQVSISNATVVAIAGPSGGDHMPAIQDGDMATSDCLIFEQGWEGDQYFGPKGEATGSFSLNEGLEIPANTTLTVPEGSTLTIPEGVTLTNNGTINISGTLSGATRVQGSGDINLMLDATGTSNIDGIPSSISSTGATYTLFAVRGFALPDAIEITDALGNALGEGAYTYDSETGCLAFTNLSSVEKLSGLKIQGSALKIPTAADFSFSSPDNLVYAGSAKEATVTPAVEGLGEVTVSYFDASGSKLESAPVNVGTYSVAIDVAKGSGYASAENVSDKSWAFTIEEAKLTVSALPQQVVFGEELPSIATPTLGTHYAIQGFVGDDDATAVSGTPIVAFTDAYQPGETSVGTLEGAVTVEEGTLSADNYEFTGFLAADLTVVRSATDPGVDPDVAADYTYGEKVEVTGAVTPTGEPAANALSLEAPAEPVPGQVALYWRAADSSETQISGPVTPAEDGSYTLTYDTAARVVPTGEQTLVVRYVGTSDMADALETLTVTIGKAPLTPQIEGAATKPYDGTTDYLGDDARVTLAGVVGEDSPLGTYELDFEHEAAGATRLLVSNVTLAEGEDAWYVLASTTAESANEGGGITKAPQNAPSGLVVSPQLVAGADDGRISGVPAGPAGAEWRAEDGSWSDVPADGAIEGLAPGAYEVRMKEGPNHEASEVTTVEVASFSATHGGLIYPDGTTENEDGEVVLPIGGGTVTFPDGTEVALPGGSAVDPDAPSVTAPDGTVMAPDGEGSLTVTFPNGAAAVVPSGSEVSDEGVLTTPDGRELRQEYTVTFDDCLDSTENQTAVVAHGSAVARPADPALDGWRFLGWYSDAALTQEWDFASPVTSDMTLYASWEKVEGSSGGSLEGTGLAGTGDPAALVAPLALAVTGAGALWASRRRS